ncbi:MAG TPA: ornithine carbamoyltransferase, partial [Kribbellaceae bacterium]
HQRILTLTALPEEARRGRRTVKDLLRTADLDAEDLETLLRLSAGFVDEPHTRKTLLAGRSVVLYFAKPSTRTRISSETAVARLGGTPVSVGPTELQLGRGETIEDTARMLSSYADAIVVRTFADDDVARLAAAASVPVINALTDGHHPLQSLADLLTLRQAFGDLTGHGIAYVGDGNNVAHSLIQAAAIVGLDIAVATPEGYRPDKKIVEDARAIADTHGSVVVVTDDPARAVAGASAVYTDVWVSMGDPETERAARTRALTPYRVTPELLARARPDAIFLHCLPAHRGDEVAAEVMDGPRSAVFQQAANRLPTVQAVLCALIEGTLTGRAV